MVIIENWIPPSRQNWDLIAYLFQWFPLVTLVQWAVTYYPAGKTSVESRFNIPGRIGWVTMEVPGFITLLYILYTLPEELGIKQLPWQNTLMAYLFVLHYIYRAILYPLLAPSMSPIHPLIWFFAVCFQLMNGIQIGGWLSGYGPVSTSQFPSSTPQFLFGGSVFFIGLFGNIFHDSILRSMRSEENRNGEKVEKHYVIPEGGLFTWILYPHYLCEWIEWCGYWIMGGKRFTPGRTFVFNEVSTMLPRAVQGKQWYLKRFGKEKVANRKSIIPGIL
ncbi:3-oxo-5-alpha-steroid 4-dehydrogenase-like protein [Xylogone sp. PMI_703]|nr:3-oxo-5-alpha-steroid 4-dehydrogenase-like protein [Xylogone sp. PMI_703]